MGFVYIATRGIGGVGGSGSRPWQLFSWREHPKPAASTASGQPDSRQPAASQRQARGRAGIIEGKEHQASTIGTTGQVNASIEHPSLSHRIPWAWGG